MGRAGALRLIFIGVGIALLSVILERPLQDMIWPVIGHPGKIGRLLSDALADRWIAAAGIVVALFGAYRLAVIHRD